MEFAYRDAIAAVNAAIGINGSLSVSHPDGLGRADPHTGRATGAVILQNLDCMEVFAAFYVHIAILKVDKEF